MHLLFMPDIILLLRALTCIPYLTSFVVKSVLLITLILKSSQSSTPHHVTTGYTSITINMSFAEQVMRALAVVIGPLTMSTPQVQ